MEGNFNGNFTTNEKPFYKKDNTSKNGGGKEVKFNGSLYTTHTSPPTRQTLKGLDQSGHTIPRKAVLERNIGYFTREHAPLASTGGQLFLQSFKSPTLLAWKSSPRTKP
jgi:hypothetical protein